MLNNEELINVAKLDEIIASLTYMPKNPQIAVAVSGGRDSMCLALLLNLWIKNKNGNLIALVVDHRLREESKVEANSVKNILESHNIKTVILTREGEPLLTGIQNKARKQRYKLISNYCKENYIPYLFVAHHFDDQLETVIMREEKGNMITGHGGMSAKVVSSDVILLRPLLNFSRQVITNTLLSMGGKWVEDPSNDNEKYQRVKVRKAITKLSIKDVQLLKAKIYQAYEDRLNLEKTAIKFFAQGIKINNLGLIKLNLRLLSNYDINFKKYILRVLLKFLSGKEYLVKIHKIDNFLDFLNNNNKNAFKYSLGNCIIFKKKSEDTLFIVKENKNLPKEVAIANLINPWDNRFSINTKKINAHHVRVLNNLEIDALLKDANAKTYFLNNLQERSFVGTLPFVFDNNNNHGGFSESYEEALLMVRENILSNIFMFIV